MTKFGQAEFAEFLAEVFLENKLDKILETAEKQNFNSKNTEDIYRKWTIVNKVDRKIRKAIQIEQEIKGC